MSVEETAIAPVTRAVAVAERLVEIRTEISSRFIEMGRLVLEAQRDNHARELGYPNFEAYVEDRLDMSYRKARYLAECVNVFLTELQIPQEEVERLGWTRAKELIPVIRNGTTENAMEWIGRVDGMKTTDINLAVRQAQAPAGQAEVLKKYEPMGIGVFDDEREIIERAIELSKLEGATDRAGRALMLICADYVAEAEARHQHQIENQTPVDNTI